MARAAALLRDRLRRRKPAAGSGLFGSDPPLVRSHATQLDAEALAPLDVNRAGRSR